MTKTQVEECYLEQLYTFCDLNRDPRSRVISIAYLGLLSEQAANKYDQYRFEIITGKNELRFQNNALSLTAKDLGFDHYNIIQKALERLRAKIIYTDIVFNLMPELFTLTQLQNVYEIITGKKETTANFRRKVMPMLKEANTFTSDMGHRPAMLYKKN